MYAVIDLETTGLRPSRHDRVVEVGIVRLDARGRVVDEWTSLVDPGRNFGQPHVHNIPVPSFGDLAGDVANLLRGHTVVAHNLSFNARFLAAEFGRLGFDIPLDADRGLCTMRLAGHFLPGAGRSLGACRAAAGLTPHHAHSALHDARAAADLLTLFLDAAGSPPPWGALTNAAARAIWPRLPISAIAPVRRRRPDEREPHFLTRLVDRLPRQHDSRADSYLALLDRALLDRHISATEADGLVDTATALGLARVDVEILHRRYLAELAAIARSDGLLTAAEQQDLKSVAQLVGLPDHTVEEAPADATPGTPWRLRAGDLVVFTGDMTPAREDWQRETRSAGLGVGDNVTRKTRLVVAADPDSMSGKAKEARQYGIPIVHPQAYRKMIEVPVPA